MVRAAGPQQPVPRRRPWRKDRLRSAPPGGYPHPVARHATPLFRRLAGLEDRLQRNKVVNLRIAVERLDGLVLDHGHLTEGVGGGLCQLTNLLYWITLHTPQLRGAWTADTPVDVRYEVYEREHLVTNDLPGG